MEILDRKTAKQMAEEKGFEYCATPEVRVVKLPSCFIKVDCNFKYLFVFKRVVTGSDGYYRVLDISIDIASDYLKETQIINRQLELRAQTVFREVQNAMTKPIIDLTNSFYREE